MTHTQPESFDTTIQKTNVILKAIEERFGWDDREKAYLALRAVLQTLRDRLTPEAVAGLGAQLPMIVRGFYYEGWQPAHAPMKMNSEEFIGEVEKRIDPLSYDEPTPQLIREVVAVVQDYTDPNELRKLKQTIPEDVRELLGLRL